MRRILISMLVLGLCINAFAGEQSETTDWDKIDSRLFIELKAQYELTDAQTYELIGRTHLQQDRWERAEIYFKKAVSLDSKLYLSWYNLGLINMDNPEIFFKKAIEANSDFPIPYYWLAYYYCHNREDAKAIPLFKKYIKIAEGNPDEAGRIKVAKEVLQDLLIGREGENLRIMRNPLD